CTTIITLFPYTTLFRSTTVSFTILSFDTQANIGILQVYAFLTAAAVSPELSKYPKLMLITSTFLSTASKIPVAIIDVGAKPLSRSEERRVGKECREQVT